MAQEQKIDQLFLENEDQNWFTKFKLYIKNSTFSILFVLLKDQDSDSNFIFYAVPIIMDYLQILNFVFHEKIKRLWNSKKLFNDVLGIFAFFDMSRFYGGVITWNLYVIFFYILIGLILFIILDIIYVSYSFQRKKFSVLWPLIILRNFVNLAVTLFFLFITETLISMIECPYDEEKNGYYHSSFTKIKCFVGWHLIHTIVSVLFNLIFVLISLIVALNYYESRISSDKKEARSNSRADVFFIINKIALQICFSFFSEEWLLIGITFTGACIIAYYYIYDDPFYDQTVGNLFKILSSLYLWTCIVLLILKITENYNFKGGIILWIVPMPFIIFISISFKKHSLRTLLKSQIKFESASELREHLLFIIQLIEKQKRDKNSYLLLVGYIQKHKEICPEFDCPLKFTQGKCKKNEITSFKETLSQLIQVIHRFYQSGIKKFKKSVKLRIAYAFFLLERLNDKKRALKELSIAEKLGPSFDEEFLIYRYKKIIADNLNLNRNSGEDQKEEIDVVGIIAFETHLKTCIHFVKKSAEFHKDFWNELLNEKPNLQKLNRIGNNINLTIKKARENWNKLIKINSHLPSIYKLYGKFLKNILNETEDGEKYLKQFHKMVVNKYDINFDKSINYANLADNTAIAFVGYKKNEFGYIKKINKEFTNMFKYTEDESINQKIDIIMPQLYQQYHQNFVNNYFDNIGYSQDYIYFNKKNKYFGKDKNGYIFQILSEVKPFISENMNSQNLLFINILKYKNKFDSNIYLITNKAGIIKDISSNTSIYFDIDVQKILTRRININSYLEKALVLHDYRSKGVEKMLETNSKQKVRSLCFVNPILMKNISDNQSEQKLVDQQQLTGFLVTIQILKQKYPVLPALKNFKNDQYKLPNSIKRNVWSFVSKNSSKIRQVKKSINIKKSNANLNLQEKLQYINNNQRIITKRLINGEIYELAEKKFYFDDETISDNSQYIKVNIKQSVFQSKLKQIQQQSIKTNKKSRRNILKKIIKNETKNKTIQLYKIFGLIWIGLTIIFSSLNLYFSYQNYDKIKKESMQVMQALNVTSYFSNLSMEYLDYEYIKRNILFINLPSYLKDQFFNESKKQIQSDIKNFRGFLNKFDKYSTININNTLDVIQNNIEMVYQEQQQEKDKQQKQQQNKQDISEEQNLDKQQFEQQDIGLKGVISKETEQNFKNQKICPKDIFMKYDFIIKVFLGKILQQINNKDLNINILQEQAKELKQIFIDYLFTDYQNDLKIVLKLFEEKSNTIFIKDIKIFSLSIVIFFIGILFLLYYVYLLKIVHRKTEKILLLFLDIPRKNLITIFKKCDNFLRFCNNYTLDKNQQKKIILMSSDEEDEFDKLINKKASRLKQKNGNSNDYFFYLISRESIIGIFRNSKSKDFKNGISIIIVIFISLIFACLCAYDFKNSISQSFVYLNEYFYKQQQVSILKSKSLKLLHYLKIIFT